MATILEFGISRMTRGLSCEMRTSGKASGRVKKQQARLRQSFAPPKKQKIKNRPIQAGLRQKENAPPNPLHHGAEESSPSAGDDISGSGWGDF